jgi:NADPH:quinone reductase-like Zn-dependent oxidoreductase
VGHQRQSTRFYGGASGIGSSALQLAKHLGAHVATTASGDDFGYVKGLGADTVIDYKKQKFEEILHDLDTVFDTIGGDTGTPAQPGGPVQVQTQP